MEQVHRRELLRYGAAAVVAGVSTAGCVSNTDGRTTNESSDDRDTDTQSGQNATDSPSMDTAKTDSENTETNETSTDREEQSQPSVQEATLEQRPGCRETVVTFDEEAVTIVGCVTGSNGCHEPVLAQAVIDESTLQVTVESADTSAEDTACTSVITDNGYRVVVRTDGNLPEQVAVIHDDIDGEQTVITAER